MPHSSCKIWIHAIWATKDRHPNLDSRIEEVLFPFIKDQFQELDCPLRIINGMPDHVHCLFLLNQKISLAEVIKQVKGSSSHFLNSSDLLDDPFRWQTGYTAYSVSESIVSKVHFYIKDQKQHHKHRNFQTEINLLSKLHKTSI